MRLCRTTLAAALLLATAACADDEPTPAPDAVPSQPNESSADDPTEPGPLDWQPTGFLPEDRAVVGAEWTAVVKDEKVSFESPAWNFLLAEETGGSVEAVLVEGESAVVSYGFGGETEEGKAFRVDLMDHEWTEIVSPQPANGGAWAMYDDSLYYPTRGEDGDYCLATLAVRDGNGEDGWCAPPRTGFSSLTASEHGVALMTFDDTRPVSCRTLHLLDDTGTPAPLDEPTECKGWDVAATATGAIWSEVPKERRQEQARFFASVDGATEDLGPGTTGSLTTCGGEAFFVRDPRSRKDPARLMRWDGTALSTAFESRSRGNAFLAEPECADGILTVTAFGEDGDEQVFAAVS